MIFLEQDPVKFLSSVKDIIHGKEIKNTEALINPEILNNFRDFKDLFEE